MGKLFLGLSRTPHGILDVATPAMAALLLLGKFPDPAVVVAGLLTAFAGYTAVYALNDLVDYRIDRERLSSPAHSESMFDVDALLVPHPVAQGLLPLRYGVIWFLFWALTALLGAWWLNPFCAILFTASAALEVIYCRLLRITHLKIIPSAVVKAAGGLAGVYAVDPSPSLAFLAVLALWLAAWEVGGQNIPNDIVDMEDDKRVAARTTLTVKGLREAVFRLVAAVGMAAGLGVAIYWLSGPGVGRLYPVGAAILGRQLLLEPARALYYDPTPRTAATLFNRASYLPAGFLALVTLSILVPL
jgi:4-hydroxybenzoate polyprenyltransferase